MKKKKSIILASVLGAALAIGGALLIPKQVDVSADWSAIQLESTYTIGASITIEPRTINVGGKNYNATSIVKLPDGTATRLTEIKLDESGLYTVVYTATVNGTHYYTEFTFTVMDEIIRIKSENPQTESSLKYGLHPTAKDKPGMMVSLAEGDSVVFAPIIDLTNSKMEDWFVELYVTSSSSGDYDFEEIEVTLTDVENPESTLTITGRRSSEGRESIYCLAAGNGQPLTGYEPAWNRLHVENEWGNPFHQPFTSMYDTEVYADKKTMKFSYDSTTRVVYATDGEKTEMIIDLDNPEHFGDQLWGGFQSGKVQLSIKADLYTKNFANFTVVNVPGVDMEGGSMLDENAPVITVDTEYAEAPKAQVGYSYPVPAATANDDYAGDVSVKKAVWFNYTSANRLSVPIVDGRFDVTQVGTYYIVYTAEDMAGNVAEKVIVVDSVATLPNITLDVDASSMDAWKNGSSYKAEAGDRIPLPTATTTGGSGNVGISYWYELDGEETLIESTQFRPISAGNYVLKVVATDYLGRTEVEEYNFTVSAATGPIFDNDPILPKYLISGYEYTLDAFYADDYTSGEHKTVLTNISIIDKNGERALGTDRKVTPVSANNGDKVTLKYTVPGTSSVYTTEVICIHKEGTITLANGSTRTALQMQNYFYPYGVEVSKPTGSVVRILKDDANGYWEFANRLGADGLNFTFNSVPSSSKFDGLKVTLQDSVDKTNEISFTIYNQVGNAYLVDETNSKVSLSCGFDANAMSNQFSVTYKGNRAYVGTSSMEITKKSDGTKFSGFKSGYVYLRVQFVNASDSDCYDITSVNGHVVSALLYDAAGPAISIIGDYGDGMGKGEWVNLPSAVASDTIDPAVTCTLTVKDPNGNVVYGYVGQTAVALNGVDAGQSYRFQASMYGAYSVTFSSKDSRQTSTAAYNVNVEDRTAPSIVFKAQFQTQISLGETIVVPKFTVSDDDSMKRVDVYLITNGGVVYTLHSSTNTSGQLGGYGFKPIYKGEYMVRVVVTDNNYNQTVVLKRIQVV